MVTVVATAEVLTVAGWKIRESRRNFQILTTTRYLLELQPAICWNSQYIIQAWGKLDYQPWAASSR